MKKKAEVTIEIKRTSLKNEVIIFAPEKMTIKGLMYLLHQLEKQSQKEE